jgi:PAS domain S-box-containing protein
MSHEKIPLEYFREAWEDVNHPMACVDRDNKFIRVNLAFEKMLGYSNAELEYRTWMEFTSISDVGGDLASVKSILDGHSLSYQLEKDYVHKKGHRVPVVLTVRRYPRASHIDFLYFNVEAPIASATRVELRDLEMLHKNQVSELEKRLREIEESQKGGVRVEAGNTTTTNSDASIKMLSGVMAVIAMSLIWIAYYITTSQRTQQPVAPPTIPAQQTE